MKNKFTIVSFFLLALLTTSCSAIEGIFKAGVGVGIFVAVAVVAVIIFIISKIIGKK